MQVLLAARARCVPRRFARDRREPLRESGRNRRRTAELRGAASGLRRACRASCAKSCAESADAPLRQVEAEFEPHRPRQPRIGACLRRPHAFDQRAEHDAVDARQAALRANRRCDTRRPGRAKRRQVRSEIAVSNRSGVVGAASPARPALPRRSHSKARASSIAVLAREGLRPPGVVLSIRSTQRGVAAWRSRRTTARFHAVHLGERLAKPRRPSSVAASRSCVARASSAGRCDAGRRLARRETSQAPRGSSSVRRQTLRASASGAVRAAPPSRAHGSRGACAPARRAEPKARMLHQREQLHRRQTHSARPRRPAARTRRPRCRAARRRPSHPPRCSSAAARR